MTKLQIQLAWKRITIETHKRSKLCEQLKSRNVSRLGDLLLYTQILLGRIESDRNIIFNEEIYRKTIDFYCKQMEKYVGFDY